MGRTAVQLFTLADVEEPLPELVARVGEAAFDGVEFYDALADEETRSRTRTALEDPTSRWRVHTYRPTRVEHRAPRRCLSNGGRSTLVIPTDEPEAFADLRGRV